MVKRLGKWKKIVITGLSCLIILSLFWGRAIAVCAEKYEYDELNRIIKVIYDDGSYVEYTYDKNGNILTTTVHENKSKNPDQQEESQESGEESRESEEESKKSEEGSKKSEGSQESAGSGDSGSVSNKQNKIQIIVNFIIKNNYYLIFYNKNVEVARIPYNDIAYPDSAVKIMNGEIIKPMKIDGIISKPIYKKLIKNKKK